MSKGNIDPNLIYLFTSFILSRLMISTQSQSSDMSLYIFSVTIKNLELLFLKQLVSAHKLFWTNPFAPERICLQLDMLDLIDFTWQ